MEDLLAARLQMALSLGFHIIFAVIGMAMPFLMATAHWFWLRTKDPEYFALTKAWSKGVAIFFATGAVSGTALSFELGLLWPQFMEHAGPIIGMPFSWEGTAFFIEAIAIGLFIYGWDRVPPYLHWFCGVVVGVSGLASGVFVICANAWMNSPTGFDWVAGQALNIDPWRAMFNDRFLNMGIHMLIAAFQATGFGVAGIHAFRILRGQKKSLHMKAMKISIVWGAVAALIQPLSGDILAKETAELQPIKLAAMEAHFETEKGAGLLIGGIPDEDTGKVKYGLKLPKLLSFLAFADFDAEVKGLNDFPRDEWPPVLLTHLSFQVMVGLGTIMALTGLLTLFMIWRRRSWFSHPRYLKGLMLLTPAGFIAVEAGWCVTELGRQPWIIYGIMKTKDALTPMPGLWVPFTMFAGVYLLLSVILVWLMVRQIRGLEQAP